MLNVTSVPLIVTPVPDAAQAKFCDTLDIDHETQMLYAGDNWAGGIDVFDISTAEPKYIRTIRMQGRIFGVAVAKNVDKVFVGMSGSTVGVIDLNAQSPTANTVVAQIPTGGVGHADLLDYDPLHKKLFVANRSDGFMVSVDATSDTVVGRVKGLGTGLEQPRFNPHDGMVYLTDNKENVLYQIDPATDTLVKTFEIADACYPNGMAIDPSTNQALLACSNRDLPHTVIWDFNEQQIAAVIEDCGCGDGATYEPTIDRFLFAASGFTGGPVMGVFGGDPVRFLTNVPTAKGASWVAFDRAYGRVFAPAVENGKPVLISFRMPQV